MTYYDKTMTGEEEMHIKMMKDAKVYQVDFRLSIGASCHILTANFMSSSTRCERR